MELLELIGFLVRDPWMWGVVFVLGFPLRALTKSGSRFERIFAGGFGSVIAGVLYSGVLEIWNSEHYEDHSLDLRVFVVRSILTGSLLLLWSLLLSQLIRTRDA